MKTFKNVAEWLKTNPEEKEMTKVLDLINKVTKREMKHLLWLKEKEMRKNLKFADDMKELGYKPTEEIKLKLQHLVSEIEEIKKEIGPIIKRVKKEEPVKE